MPKVPRGHFPGPHFPLFNLPFVRPSFTSCHTLIVLSVPMHYSRSTGFLVDQDKGETLRGLM